MVIIACTEWLIDSYYMTLKVTSNMRMRTACSNTTQYGRDVTEPGPGTSQYPSLGPDKAFAIYVYVHTSPSSQIIHIYVAVDGRLCKY